MLKASNNDIVTKRNNLLEFIGFISNEGFDGLFEILLRNPNLDAIPDDLSVKSSIEVKTLLDSFRMDSKNLNDYLYKLNNNSYKLVNKLGVSLDISIFLDKETLELSWGNNWHLDGKNNYIPFASKLKVASANIEDLDFSCGIGIEKLKNRLKESAKEFYESQLKLQLLNLKRNEFNNQKTALDLGFRSNIELQQYLFQFNIDQRSQFHLYFFKDDVIKTHPDFKIFVKSLSYGFNFSERKNLINLLKMNVLQSNILELESFDAKQILSELINKMENYLEFNLEDKLNLFINNIKHSNQNYEDESFLLQLKMNKDSGDVSVEEKQSIVKIKQNSSVFSKIDNKIIFDLFLGEIKTSRDNLIENSELVKDKLKKIFIKKLKQFRIVYRNWEELEEIIKNPNGNYELYKIIQSSICNDLATRNNKKSGLAFITPDSVFLKNLRFQKIIDTLNKGFSESEKIYLLKLIESEVLSF